MSTLEFAPGKRMTGLAEWLVGFSAWLASGAIVAIAALGLLIFGGEIRQQGLSPRHLVVLLFLLSFFLYFVASRGARWAYKSAVVRQQRAFDRRVAIGAELREGFILYLRPFNTDDDAFFSMNGEPITLQRVVAQSLWSFAPVKQIAQVDDGGAVVRYANSEWQTRVEQDMVSARAVVVLPLRGPGTLWEILALSKHGLLSRTVFVMPNLELATRYRWSLSDYWNEVASALRAQGLPFPSYTPRGGLFRLVSSSGALAIDWLDQPLSEQGERAGKQIRKAVKRIAAARLGRP